MIATVRLVLVDDHAAVREGVRARLEVVPRFMVVGEAGDIPGAVAQVEAARPDIALLDIALGKMSGLLLARILNERFPQTRLLVLSMYAKPEYVAEAWRAGVRGYVLKSGPVNEIVSAIDAVLAGGTYCSPGVDRAALPRPALTPAEKAVLPLVARGLSSRQVAKRLKVDVRTIETHRRNIMAKLGAKNAVQVVTLAISLGIVDVHDVIPEGPP